VRFRTPSLSSWLLAVTVVYLAVGLVMFGLWKLTGENRWIVSFFQGPGAMLALALALTSLTMSHRAAGFFPTRAPMHSAWSLFRLSAICDVFSVLSTQFVPSARPAGQIVGGTFRYALLAGALWYALKAYRSSGLLARYRPADYLLLGIMAAFLAYALSEILTVLLSRRPSLAEAASWPVDPLLWFLLAQALLLRRSAFGMEGGHVARCWKALAAGVILVALGDIALLAARQGYLTHPWSALEWYIWLPAGAAFALAPVYQVEAVAAASSHPSPAR
jgi:hypothetical protein